MGRALSGREYTNAYTDVNAEVLCCASTPQAAITTFGATEQSEALLDALHLPRPSEADSESRSAGRGEERGYTEGDYNG